MFERRLQRLRIGRFYPILAIDHGLTVGFGDIIKTSKIAYTLTSCKDSIRGVVMTYGIARSVGETFSTPLILQCFGSPSGHPRVKIASIEQAIALDAAAVSVQIDLQHQALAIHLREIADFVSEAHNMCIPVMFMTAGFCDLHIHEICKAIRVSHELGADLIKVPYHASAFNGSAEVDDLKAILQASPPTLLA